MLLVFALTLQLASLGNLQFTAPEISQVGRPAEPLATPQPAIPPTTEVEVDQPEVPIAVATPYDTAVAWLYPYYVNAYAGPGVSVGWYGGTYRGGWYRPAYRYWGYSGPRVGVYGYRSGWYGPRVGYYGYRGGFYGYRGGFYGYRGGRAGFRVRW